MGSLYRLGAACAQVVGSWAIVVGVSVCHGRDLGQDWWEYLRTWVMGEWCLLHNVRNRERPKTWGVGAPTDRYGIEHY